MSKLFVKQVQIPAKGMLWGEYGVLQCFPAIAVTFYRYYFKIKVSLSKKKLEHENSVNVKSSFFSQGEISFSLHNFPTDKGFFYQLLLPWQDFLNEFNLEIEILNSFPPSLGFGSSSAIIAGVSLALYEYFINEKNILENSLFWQKLRRSIKNIQGQGSGYDVGVQLAAILNSEQDVCCWSFQNQEKTCVPIINKINIPIELMQNYGCFVKTNIYSDTKKILAQYSSLGISLEKNSFARFQGELAAKFLQNFTLENIKKLMQEAQKIFPFQEYSQNLNIKLNTIPYKSMGAGHGDCLWVLAQKLELVKYNILKDDIAFAFEDIQ